MGDVEEDVFDFFFAEGDGTVGGPGGVGFADAGRTHHASAAAESAGGVVVHGEAGGEAVALAGHEFFGGGLVPVAVDVIFSIRVLWAVG